MVDWPLIEGTTHCFGARFCRCRQNAIQAWFGKKEHYDTMVGRRRTVPRVELKTIEAGMPHRHSMTQHGVSQRQHDINMTQHETQAQATTSAGMGVN
jgi:hypothetical protein